MEELIQILVVEEVEVEVEHFQKVRAAEAVDQSWKVAVEEVVVIDCPLKVVEGLV